MPTQIPTAQDVIDAWNANFPIGTEVRYWPGSLYGAGHLGRTTSAAWLLGEIPVVRIGREAGGIALAHVDPCPEPEPATDDFCAGCAIQCLCDTSKYEDMSDAQLDALAALDVNLADDTSINREQARRNGGAA